jgi:hypothetical protein
MAAKSHHARLFEQLVAEHRHALLEGLVSNLDQMVVGMIRGLDVALKLSEEADFKLSGEK